MGNLLPFAKSSTTWYRLRSTSLYFLTSLLPYPFSFSLSVIIGVAATIILVAIVVVVGRRRCRRLQQQQRRGDVRASPPSEGQLTVAIRPGNKRDEYSSIDNIARDIIDRFSHLFFCFSANNTPSLIHSI